MDNGYTEYHFIPLSGTLMPNNRITKWNVFIYLLQLTEIGRDGLIGQIALRPVRREL